MKKFYFLLFLFVIAFQFSWAQRRYLDPMFPVLRTADVVYGKNISIITGMPATEDLKADIYTPAGDSKTDRPLVLIAHTGSFLPPLYNGQITGARTDSTVVNTAAYLASRGFVVAAYTYRLGWLPTSPDQNARTGSLLQAAYRGIQDTRSCIRYFKESVAEYNNPYGIDPSKICVWGIGTGGYLALGSGSLNDFGEVTLPKFINTQTLLPFIDSTLMGNMYGTTQTPLCLPNHPNYSSNFQLSVNLGGALGDSSWLDGEDIEPAYTGVHCTNDFFAPYYEGPVIVPTTNQFVIYATGTRKCIEVANNLGSNDILKNVDPLLDVMKSGIDAQKATQTILPLTMQNILLGTDNFYGFETPLIYNGRVTPQGSPWEWWDLNTLRVIVQIVNAQRGTNFNADTLHLNGLATNPDMSADKGRAYLDTTFRLVLPRMCVALDLGCQAVGLKEVEAHEIGLSISPVPAVHQLRFETSNDQPMQSIHVYDIHGKLVKAHTDINSNTFVMPRNQLQAGFYISQIRTRDHIVTKQILIQD
ncbi:MAG: T9SS type A sorting domain-containing protein [Saprospiraceae bacterium]|nr:T9SS type A sorting domain-containing protein [Saprospiraceae bacterium]